MRQIASYMGLFCWEKRKGWPKSYASEDSYAQCGQGVLLFPPLLAVKSQIMGPADAGRKDGDGGNDAGASLFAKRDLCPQTEAEVMPRA